MKILIFCLIYFQCFSGFSSSFQQFLGALSQVESGGNNSAVGDGGRSIGRYQITKLYFIDAQRFNTNLNKYKWRDCLNKNISEQVVWAYMNKYEPAAVRNKDWETLAKCHNGGCGWRSKTGQAKLNLEKYWNKIKLAMDE